MKTLKRLCVVVAVAVAFLAPRESTASVSFDFFYDSLGSYGDWNYLEDYGYCWQPYGVGAGWRPYADGSWVYTDAGWTWCSNESWGWATYHYGRWAMVGGVGWVWVPGYEWGPAWVSWRRGPRYVGWAPLPPAVGWGSGGIRFGFSFGFDVGPSYYNFCEPRYFGARSLGSCLVPSYQNVNIIQNTTNITNITRIVNNNRTVIFNEGPDFNEVNRQANNQVRRARLKQNEITDVTAARQGKAQLKESLKGDVLEVSAPKITAASKNAAPKKVKATLPAGQVDDGWASIKDKNQARKLREQVRKEADESRSKAGVAARPERAALREKEGQTAANRQDKSRNETARQTPAKPDLKPFQGQNADRSRKAADTAPGARRETAKKAAATAPKVTDRPANASAGQQKAQANRKAGTNGDLKPFMKDATSRATATRPSPNQANRATGQSANTGAKSRQEGPNRVATRQNEPQQAQPQPQQRDRGTAQAAAARRAQAQQAEIRRQQQETGRGRQQVETTRPRAQAPPVSSQQAKARPQTIPQPKLTQQRQPQQRPVKQQASRSKDEEETKRKQSYPQQMTQQRMQQPAFRQPQSPRQGGQPGWGSGQPGGGYRQAMPQATPNRGQRQSR
jgi:hypothetical protein